MKVVVVLGFFTICYVDFSLSRVLYAGKAIAMFDRYTKNEKLYSLALKNFVLCDHSINKVCADKPMCADDV